MTPVSEVFTFPRRSPRGTNRLVTIPERRPSGEERNQMKPQPLNDQPECPSFTGLEMQSLRLSMCPGQPSGSMSHLQS